MVVKGKLLFGPILVLIGGLIFLFSSFLVSEALIEIGHNLSDVGLQLFEVGLFPELMIIAFVCTIVWGALAIIGGIIAIFGKKFGSILALNAGILGLVGALIPLGYNIAVTQIQITLTGSFFLLDPILMILGGLLGLTLRE